MNPFQGANSAATFLILSALVGGLARQLDTLNGGLVEYAQGHRPLFLLAAFVVCFRIKTWLDDHRHFAEPHQDKTAFRYAGFLLAIFSWIFWGVAAYLIHDTVRASQLMVVSLVLSTAWLVVHVVEILWDRDRRNKEVVTGLMREKWAFVNMCYVLCLGAHIGWFAPLVRSGGAGSLVALLLLLLFDIFTSSSFVGVISPKA